VKIAPLFAAHPNVEFVGEIDDRKKGRLPRQRPGARTIVDTLTRLSPAVGVRRSYRGSDVVETLEHGASEFGYPKTIRVDNGPEFVSKELDLWAYMKGVTLDFSRPGKPTDNAFIESFNGKFRAECLNANWFLSLDEARAKCEAWRRDYNEVRPHSAIATGRRWSFIG
jgi:putative transposase